MAKLIDNEISAQDEQTSTGQKQQS